jgi:hypothetical protein
MIAATIGRRSNSQITIGHFDVGYGICAATTIGQTSLCLMAICQNDFEYTQVCFIKDVCKQSKRGKDPSKFYSQIVMSQLKTINHKQIARWQHLSRLKASAFFSLQKN